MELNPNQTFQTSQKPEQEKEIDFDSLSEEKKQELIRKGKIPLKKMLPKPFLKNLDSNFKYFCKGIKSNLKEENYELIAITGYAGSGKSQLGAIQGCLIDSSYTYSSNINFIPTSTEIEKDYLKLPPYSYLHIDEASRSIHKHKWYEKTQQKLATLYDTERENHYVCSCLIMPRFQNFTENFRNFFIKYWINIVARGIAIVYKRDEDKDTKDPWNIDDSFKLKQKAWKGKRVFERSIADIIRTEQKTKNYWFYFQIPEIPKEIWLPYKYLKKLSREEAKENDSLKVESHREKMVRERRELRENIKSLLNKGYNKSQIAVKIELSPSTVHRYMKEIEALESFDKPRVSSEHSNNNIYKLKDSSKPKRIPSEFDKI